MAQQADHSDDSPEFEPSPAYAQAGIQPDQAALGDPNSGHRSESSQDRNDDSKDINSTRDNEFKNQSKHSKPSSGSKSEPNDQHVAQDKQNKPNSPARTSTASLLSSSILMIVGAAIAAGTYLLAREFAPPSAPKEEAKPPADMVKTEDFKKLSDQVDKMNADLMTAKKQIADRPDYAPDIKTVRDRMTELDRTLAGIAPQFDSINQKLATMTKVEDSTSASQVEMLNKRLDELTQSVSSSRTKPIESKVGNGNPMVENDSPGLDRAIELYKTKKWSEARDAFARLQETNPNNAVVWYLAALANGFATGEWQAGSETERLVNVGLIKEKAGQPSSEAIDSVVSFLTVPSGKEWLAEYRKRLSR